jgi:hypothetical protein
MGQLSIDRTSVEFAPGAADQRVTITNGAPGPFDLRVDPHAEAIKGLTVKVDKLHLEAGDKAVVTFHRERSEPISDSVVITAAPLNRVFTVMVTAK